MPLTNLLKHLAQAKKHVAMAERNLAQQRSIVADFERDGQDSTEAKKLLARFEEVHRLHVASMERIRRELAASIAAT